MNHERAYPKRLIEVDLPIKRISAHARREKSIRHGHISTLHIWWARRPLAACRAVICAALWLDPADPLCPQKFRNDASRLINEFAQRAATDKDFAKHCSPETWVKWQTLARNGGLDPANEDHSNVLRNALLDFIADFANWDNSAVPEYLATSRALTRSAHESLGGTPGTRPLVFDPFAGGGSIPLEALRVGADAFAVDINPVAVLLNKVILEYVPKFGTKLADEIRKWGFWLKTEAEGTLSELFPPDPDGSVPIAYIWARTIKCEGPGCGAQFPLLRSLWLSKKGKNSVALKVVPNATRKTVSFSVISGAEAALPGAGTIRRSAATCPVCSYTTPEEAVRRQFLGRRSGADDAQLAAVVLSKPGKSGKSYRSANRVDESVIKRAKELLKHLSANPGALPSEPLPYLRSIFNIKLLGANQWSDLFSARQLVVLLTLTDLVRQVYVATSGYDQPLREALVTCLAFAVDRHIDQQSSLVTWIPTIQAVSHTFVRQALGITWDFCEPNPISSSGGNVEGAVEWVAKVIEQETSAAGSQGQAQQASATDHLLPDESVSLVATDPPYYDAVPYADLSDFFYVWLKRMLRHQYPDLFREELTPKRGELVQLAERNPAYAFKSKEYFEAGMTRALEQCRRSVSRTGLGVVVFAHKGTAAWETMIASVIESGWIATASWPIDTERSVRLRARDSAALASSVHLVCRPRENKGDSSHGLDVGDWRDVLIELPRRIREWLPRLQSEGIVGADAIFACLGPALEVFSQYTRVEKASGEKVELKEYLEKVWAAVAQEALNMIFEGADATGFEEDARLTAMWLWTLSTGSDGNGAASEADEDEEDEEDSGKKAKMSGFALEYDAARKIAQGLGAHLERLTSLVEVRGDKARLLPVSERARHLFGKDEGAAPTKRKAKPKQLSLLDEVGELEEGGGWGEKNAPRAGISVLDRIHQSMILFAAGRNEALKRFLVSDGAGQDQRFWRLAQALSALYPSGTDERRWVEGVLARKKGLGF